MNYIFQSTKNKKNFHGPPATFARSKFVIQIMILGFLLKMGLLPSKNPLGFLGIICFFNITLSLISLIDLWSNIWIAISSFEDSALAPDAVVTTVVTSVVASVVVVAS